MDVNSFLAIVVALVIAYFFIKLVVSPLLKAVFGVIIFLVIIYILQRYFNFNFNGLFGPFSKYLDLNKPPINYYINQANTFWQSILKNITKS